MLGIISVIVAIIKGRTGWAWFFSLWTAFALIMAVTGNEKLAFGPGIIFLTSAFSMENYRKNSHNQFTGEKTEDENEENNT